MRQAYLCTNSNHSNGVHQNLLVLNFSIVCSCVSSSMIPVRNLLCLYLPSRKQQSIDYWRKNLSKSGYTDKCGSMCRHVCLCKRHIHMRDVLMYIYNVFTYIALMHAWKSISIICLPNVSFFHQLLVALLECFYYLLMKLCTTSFDCSTESVIA